MTEQIQILLRLLELERSKSTLGSLKSVFSALRRKPSSGTKVNIVHLLFVGIHEQEISASSVELFRGDPRFNLSIKLLTHCLALNITI